MEKENVSTALLEELIKNRQEYILEYSKGDITEIH